MKQTESILQQHCIKAFRFQYPKQRLKLFAIPNGHKRHIRTAVKLKAEGVIAGIPDLFLAIPKNNYGGLFIEMKSDKGRLTENQKEFFKEMAYSYRCVVCKSVDEFLNEVKNYLL